MKLSEDAEERIEAEEIFRHEVRIKLANKETKTGPALILAFFNTGFGLWLLSMVAVGLVSIAYTAAQSHFAQARERSERSEKLVVELHTRVMQIDRILETDGLISEVSKEGPEALSLIARFHLSTPRATIPLGPFQFTRSTRIQGHVGLRIDLRRAISYHRSSTDRDPQSGSIQAIGLGSSGGGEEDVHRRSPKAVA